MLNAILVSIRFILLILGDQKHLALENAALPQQLAVFKRNVRRPKLNDRDRLSWIGLKMIWKDWKSALLIVRPETVISWHRKRFSGTDDRQYSPRMFKPRDRHKPATPAAKLKKLLGLSPSIEDSSVTG